MKLLNKDSIIKIIILSIIVSVVVTLSSTGRTVKYKKAVIDFRGNTVLVTIKSYYSHPNGTLEIITLDGDAYYTSLNNCILIGEEFESNN